MAPPEVAPARRAPASMVRHGYVFGLEIEGELEIPHVAAARAPSSGRRLRTELDEPRAIDRRWNFPGVATVVDRRYPDGRPFLAIAEHASLGFRIWAPHYGRYEISPDGTRLRCAVPSRTSRWQRLLFAQALPLAAALQGMDLFHASAVSIDGRVAAFVGGPGAGKTSLAAHLVDRGATLVTDDVLALEATAGAVVAHPGAGVLCIEEHELGRLASIGHVVGRSDKLHAAVPVAELPAPLEAVYYLERRSTGRLRISMVDPPDPRLLLGSSFLTYLRSARVLSDHLEVCAQVARTARTFRIEIPPNADAGEVAAAVEDRASSP